MNGMTMLMLCGLSSALECDRARHYIVQSDRKVKCIDCRVCPPGYEPRVPCGKIIGANVSVGDCDPCKSGTYSPKKDFKACQDCQYKKCFDHQVVEGTCTDKNDMSRCTDKCEEGYIMNKRATACEVDLPLQNKTTTLATKTRSIPSTSPTTKTRSIPSTSPTTKTRSIRPSTSPTTKTRSIPSTSPTTKTRSNPSTSPTTKTRSIPSTSPTTNRHYRNTSHAQTDKESKLDSGVIAGIVIGVIVIVIIFIISICWYKSRSTEQGAKDDEELQGSTAELLDQPDEGEKGEAVKFSVQENNDSATLNDVMGTFSQQVNSSPSNNVGNDVSDTVMGCTQNAHLTRFGGLSFQTYSKMCQKFDAGTPGIGWTNLASWLDLKVEDVEEIKMRENKAHHIIQRWGAATENTEAKFVQILEEHGITRLADKIKAELNNSIST